MDTTSKQYVVSPSTDVKTIFHAHNWSFERIREQLRALSEAGYDAIQLSPAQKSPPGNAWYLRYQPYDYLQIEGLGSRIELMRLCAEAKTLGLRIIADVVFNHMAVPDGLRREQWLAAEKLRIAGNDEAIEKLYSALDKFPHLTRADFQPWRDMQGDDWDNENRYEGWGNGEWPELKPTENVLRIHNQHLAILYDCGVRGFRFDAVKHMRVDHLAKYVKTIHSFAEPCWFYGEVFSENVGMHREYDTLFPTTDFPYIKNLKTHLKSSKAFNLEPRSLFLSSNSIRFGNNHDLTCNPKELVAGLLFEKPEHTRFANCLSLLLAGGTGLVFAEDHIQDKVIRSCVLLRKKSGDLNGPVTVQTSDEMIWTVEARNGSIVLDFGKNKIS